MAGRRVTREVALRLRGDGSLRLAAVADTHSRPHPAAAGQPGPLRPDAILHADDIGDFAVLNGLAAIAPVYAVRGNIDARTYRRGICRPARLPARRSSGNELPSQGQSQCAGIVPDGPSATVRDGRSRRPAEPDFAHACAPSRTVRTPPPPHGIQEVVGSTPIGSTIFAGLAF